MDKKTNETFLPVLKNSGTTPYKIEDLEQNLVQTSDDFAIYPDSLLNYLQKNKVDFIIAGRLRENPTQKNDQYINTIHQYIYYIEQKYPSIFTFIWQEGNNNDEPAMLLKINYPNTTLR